MREAHIAALAILFFMAFWDFLHRKIPLWLLLGSCAGAVLYQVCFRALDFYLIAGGAAVGILFLAVSKMTGEGFGYGDSIGIFVLGLFLGLWNTIEVLCFAFFGLMAGAVWVLAVKKMSRKAAVPFYPFLTLGYALWLWMEM